MRHEDYSQSRHDLMREVRIVRTKLIDRCEKKRAGKEYASPDGAGRKACKTSTAADLDAKQLEKVQMRQQREIEQMLAFEMRQVELQEGAARRFLEMDKKRLAQKKKRQEKARKRAAEQKK